MSPEDERFATEIEKSIYNVGLANQDRGAGLRYHTILEGKKEKSTHENTCCEGQGTRLLGSLPEHIYSIAPDGVYVHLYEPSSIRWSQSGQPVEMTMNTQFPFAPKVEVSLNTSSPIEANIRIRVPSWASGQMALLINGRPAGSGHPGSYVSLERKWRSGDQIEFTLPASVRVRKYSGSDQVADATRFSVEYGPILLAAIGSSNVTIAMDRDHELKDIAGYLQPIDGEKLQFSVRGNAGLKFVPYWQIVEGEFTCYPKASMDV